MTPRAHRRKLAAAALAGACAVVYLWMLFASRRRDVIVEQYSRALYSPSTERDAVAATYAVAWREDAPFARHRRPARGNPNVVAGGLSVLDYAVACARTRRSPATGNTYLTGRPNVVSGPGGFAFVGHTAATAAHIAGAPHPTSSLRTSAGMRPRSSSSRPSARGPTSATFCEGPTRSWARTPTS